MTVKVVGAVVVVAEVVEVVDTVEVIVVPNSLSKTLSMLLPDKEVVVEESEMFEIVAEFGIVVTVCVYEFCVEKKTYVSIAAMEIRIAKSSSFPSLFFFILSNIMLFYLNNCECHCICFHFTVFVFNIYSKGMRANRKRHVVSFKRYAAVAFFNHRVAVNRFANPV